MARLADIGSGAGFPGLPLKIVMPGLRLSLMESSHKKISFCREVVRSTGMEDVAFIEERAEEALRARRYLQSFDWIVTRAFRAGAETLRLVHPFLAPGGSCALYKGDPEEQEIQALEKEAARNSLVLQNRPVPIPFLAASRRLLVVGPPPP
jgi:16S rRNA (guanine527-N7)-methyltransferase